MRIELQCPKLDESLVRELSVLADQIDGRPESSSDELIAKFNQLSGMRTPYEHFQGVCGGDGHGEWVRNILATKQLPTIENLNRDDLVDAFEKIKHPDTPDFERTFIVDTIATNINDPNLFNLIYFPDEYLGEELPNDRELTAAEMADIVATKLKPKIDG